MCAILNNLIYANFYFQYKLDIHRHEKWPLDSISDLLNFLSSTHLWPIVVGFLCPLWVCLSWMCVLGGFLSDLIRPAGFTRLAASGAAWLGSDSGSGSDCEWDCDWDWDRLASSSVSSVVVAERTDWTERTPTSSIWRPCRAAEGCLEEGEWECVDSVSIQMIRHQGKSFAFSRFHCWIFNGARKAF